MEQTIEYIGFVLGILYLLCEIRQYRLMWALGALSGVMYAVIFFRSSLYAAALLQVYYAGIALYGVMQWNRGKRQLEDRSAENRPAEEDAARERIFYRLPGVRTQLAALAALAGFTALFATVLRNLTGDPMPFPDALATALSIVATYWLSKSYLPQWLLWVVVDGITVYLSVSQQLYATAVLYGIYTAAAVYGYFHWKKKGVLLPE